MAIGVLVRMNGFEEYKLMCAMGKGRSRCIVKSINVILMAHGQLWERLRRLRTRWDTRYDVHTQFRAENENGAFCT